MISFQPSGRTLRHEAIWSLVNVWTAREAWSDPVANTGSERLLQNAFQAVRGEAVFGKNPLETAETDSRVNQETCGARGRFPQEKAAVAAAAGSETQETDHQCSSSRQYFEMTR